MRHYFLETQIPMNTNPNRQILKGGEVTYSAFTTLALTPDPLATGLGTNFMSLTQHRRLVKLPNVALLFGTLQT
jgi:hypothetical protein